MLALLVQRWFPPTWGGALEMAVDMAIVLVTAVVCGFIVGIEREKRERPAGLRTHILVCVGSAAFVHLGVTAMAIAGGEGPAGPFGTVADFNRLVQSIAMGIGFLGAGVIFRAGDHVSGITTAASIWVMGAAGAAAGAGAVVFALAISVLTHLVLRGLRASESRQGS